jgi:hypothetical protein
MKIHKIIIGALVGIILLSTAMSSSADVFGSGTDQFTINFVFIGNAGNANDATGYWQYADGSNSAPTAVASGTAAGTAVYNQPNMQGPTAVDQSGGLSPYGTQGQTGNVYQWTETDDDDPTNSSASNLLIQGGAWLSTSDMLQSNEWLLRGPTGDFNGLGFRVAAVPEPNSLMLILAGIGGMAILRGKRARL